MVEPSSVPAGLRPIDIDKVKDGVMVYNAAGLPLGVIRLYLGCNANYRAKERRHLDNGKWKDRYAYRREALYRDARKAGPVFIKPTEQKASTEDGSNHE